MTAQSGFCMFVMHSRCDGGPAGYPCGCGCHQPGAAPAPSRDRTSPPRDLSDQVDAHGLVQLDVLVGTRRTGANLPPQTAAVFLRELADDLDRIPARPTALTTPGVPVVD